MITEVTKLLGIQYPVIQGGMAWVSDAYLAAAVSNAGGLGIIAAMNAPANYLREQIALAIQGKQSAQEALDKVVKIANEDLNS